jgi:hypothetical protein
MTIVAIVISPPQMALRVMLTAASESSSAIDDSDSQDTDGSERQDSAANESWDSAYRKQFANGANYGQSKPGFCRRGDAIAFEW